MKTRKVEIKRQMLNDLSFNLNCEVLAYRKLLQLANEIQEALLSDKIEQILNKASLQAKLASKLQAHEEARMVLCEKLANCVYESKPVLTFAMPKDSLSLSKLISLVPEPYAKNYAILRNELHSLISKLDVLCFQNTRLISSNIKYIDEMFKMVATLSRDSDSTYINTGKIDNSGSLATSATILDYSL